MESWELDWLKAGPMASVSEHSNKYSGFLRPGNFLAVLATISYPWKALHHEVPP
jgi:hypothetical protein